MSLYNGFFFHDMIRKYTVAFGNLFDDLYVVRFKSDGTEDHRERVPLTYSEKEKFYSRDAEDPDENKKISMKLPRMGYEMVNISYDPDRKLQTMNSVSNNSPNPANRAKMFTPVPYNFNFRLYIMTKHLIEGNMLVEQILPFFAPDWNVGIVAVPSMCLNLNVPIILTGIEKSDNYQGPYQDRRLIIWTLDFTVRGYLFPPVADTAVIKQTIVNFRPDPQISYDQVVGTPTLAGKTYQQILPTDPYEYIVTTTEIKTP